VLARRPSCEFVDGLTPKGLPGEVLTLVKRKQSFDWCGSAPPNDRTGASFSQEYILNALIEELSVRALALPPEDRARLAEELLASLRDDPGFEADAAWDLEIRRRVEKVKSATAKLIAAEDVHAEARQIYR
jgi:putative addiction module component (TIGR02574 family)